jgi:CheY-like chemotaxis protein
MPTILVADDNPIDRRITRRVLESAGKEVVEAVDGEAAWAVLSGPEPPPIAVLDWNMPGADGLELCRRVRTTAALSSLYVILLTARTATPDVVAGLDAGADDFIHKPVVPAELLARVRVGERVTHLQAGLAAKVHELEAAVSRIQQLHGLIPMCCVCKRVRNDDDYWQQVEAYLARYAVRITHGYCPECFEEALGQSQGPYASHADPDEGLPEGGPHDRGSSDDA